MLNKFLRYSCLFILFAHFLLFSFPQFTSITSLPESGDLKRVIWHNGYFYAVGSYSTILRSSDGIHWNKDSVDQKNSLFFL